MRPLRLPSRWPSLWPRSLFGRLIAALVIAVVLAQGVGLFLFARDRERFVLDSSVRDWSRRITDMTLLLEQLPREQRAATIVRLKQLPIVLRQVSAPGPVTMQGPAPGPMLSTSGPLFLQPPNTGVAVGVGVDPPRGAAGFTVALPAGPGVIMRGYGPGPATQPMLINFMPDVRDELPWRSIFIRLPFALHIQGMLEQQLRADLGGNYAVSVKPAAAPAARVIFIPSPFFGLRSQGAGESYDVDIRFPDHTQLVYRVVGGALATALPMSLVGNLLLLVMLLMIALYMAARGITRPLSDLVQAADNLGRSVGQPKLRESGALELRRAAHAFNTMQDRLSRYLDSRTRVLAAMSHDLKTPLTRLRLQVETQIEDPMVQERLGRELDEMESMVRGALALFRGLNDQEVLEPVDVNALLDTVRGELTELGHEVATAGHALGPFMGRPQALKRCITNLVANAVKFGIRARVLVQDGAQLQIAVLDDGPGIPIEELEMVFEPFYRLESSRNRDTGGTGLGLSIARDVAQAHGGSLVLRNRPEGGLEALLTLPRRP